MLNKETCTYDSDPYNHTIAWLLHVLLLQTKSRRLKIVEDPVLWWFWWFTEIREYEFTVSHIWKVWEGVRKVWEGDMNLGEE